MTGMMKMAMQVAANMPPMTAPPMTCRDRAPAPLAMASGTQPRMKANEVIRIGRRRSWAPLRVASTSDNSPFSYSILANSTIRMAFLAARPISITRPICA